MSTTPAANARAISINGERSLLKSTVFAVFLACDALRKGYSATIYTYNLMVFDPTWFGHDDVNIAESVKNLAQLVRLDAVHLEVPVFRLEAHQLVAHAAADEHRTATRLMNCRRQFFYLFSSHDLLDNMYTRNRLGFFRLLQAI